MCLFTFSEIDVLSGRLSRRESLREKSVLLDELLRDLEDLIKLMMSFISFLFDRISRRLARQDKL
jgi:hypothetical protein